MTMRVGVVFFHKNITSIYKDRWVKKSVESMLNQTHSDFFIYEVNYGNEEHSVVSEFDVENKKFYKKDFNNHAEAMNFIITKAFEDGCNYVFNTNLDDYYDKTRIEKQLVFLNKGFDIVSSDFCYIRDIGDIDEVFLHMKIKEHGDIKNNLLKNHNVIAHPCVAMSSFFWSNNRYDITKPPREDLDLWKRSIESGTKFYIHDEELLFYRIHGNQLSTKK